MLHACLSTNIYIQGWPKKASNQMRAILGQRAQSGPKWPKMAQTVQENLDGPKWSENLVSQHHAQNSVLATFFGHPV